MAIHASITIVDDRNQPNGLKSKDRTFGDKNEAVHWEVVNRSATTLYDITFDNFVDGQNTAIDASDVFKKLDPIAVLVPGGSNTIKGKLRAAVANGVYGFDVVAALAAGGAKFTINDPEMEVCQDITILGVNWNNVKNLPKAPAKKHSRKKKKK
jgi:hypothetical protein